MKKLSLTLISVLTILFTQAQCQAYFGYMQNGPTTIFTDSSTMQSTNFSATWSWDFGDGNTSTQQNPIHTYSNGIYSACLIVTFFDLTIMSYCTSVYCDSIFIGNAPPASWDCDPVSGCFDPGTGLGQYSTLTACQTACGVIPSWDCDPVSGCYDPGTGLGQYLSFIHCDTTCGSANAPSWDCDPVSGCYDPGTGLGQYSTLTACQTACGVIPSWDCDPVSGCYDPGTGLGLYNTLISCQSNCSGAAWYYCDSMTASGSQSQITMQVNGVNTFIDYWVTTGSNAVLGEDSISFTHNVFNYNASTGLPYDTITTCITYTMNSPITITCCVTWVWNGAFWEKTGSVNSIGEINFTDKKLIRVVDVLGRKTFLKSNETLFFIYDDGTVEKKIIIE